MSAEKPADAPAPAGEAPQRLSQLDDPKEQCWRIAGVLTGQFSSASCYMAMMFFALSTAINCVVLDESLDDRALPISPLTSSSLRVTYRSPTPGRPSQPSNSASRMRTRSGTTR